MAVTNFTPLLGLALPTTGDLSGTWGTTVNTAITDLLDDAVAGTVTLSADADVTLTTTNGADNQARNAVILWTASNGATTRNITAPAQSKAYVVINAGTGSVVIRGSGPTTGVTVVSGEKCLVAWNGSDFVKISTTEVDGVSTISFGSTGLTPSTATSGAVTVAGTLAVANGGTGATTAPDALTNLAAAGTGISNTFTANQIVSVTDNTNAALRITQLGTGNALLVEDSTNPDASPFVIDANGNVIVGYTSVITTPAGTAPLQIQTAANLIRYSASFASSFEIGRSKSATIGTNASLASGDKIGQLDFIAADGTTYLSAARIEAAVDGTPGTNDMPGRLVFSTTADGASSTNERMRIDSAGNVGIGGTASAGQTLVVSKNITGAVTSIAYDAVGTIQSDVTNSAIGYRTNLSTQATSFTLTGLRHFLASQGTIGASSVVTNQFGFVAQSNLTGATNNFGFYGDIASGTNRFNLYMAGTANNYMAGSLGIGTAPSAGQTVFLAKTITGNVNSTQIRAQGVVQSDVTTSVISFDNVLITAAAAFTLSNYYHFNAQQATIGATSAVTNQYGFQAASTLTGATNNYGFYGNIASGTNRYNLYMAGTADNYLAGKLGIGANASSVSFYNARNITGNTISYANYSQATIQSDVTSQAFGYRSGLSTQASAFTLGNIFNFYANQGTIGATSAVTNQYGFIVDSSLTGATNNYGFYGDIAEGTGRWNLYMNGTAANYLAGRLGIGATAGSDTSILSGKNITGATVAFGFRQLGSIQSDVTSQANGIQSAVSTAAASFTLTNLRNFFASQGTIGATSSVTNQYGFFADSGLTGATNNFGFYGDIASGAGRFNLYMAGTAANRFNGDLLVYGGTAIPAGGTTGSGYKFSSTANFGVFFGSGAPTLSAAKGSLYLRSDGTTTNNRMYVNTDGSTTWTAVTTAA